MCLQKFPHPWGADFPKSATGQLPKLPTCACRNSPPSLQIFQNLPLDRYLHVLAEIPPWGADFPKSATGQLPKLPTCACRNFPQFADFPKSATGQIATCAYRNSPLGLQIFQNLPLDRYLHVLTEIPPPVADFPKFATGQLPKLPTCNCRNSPTPHLQIFQTLLGQKLQKFPPSLQIFQNLPLDRYLHVLTEIPPGVADFPKSATGQLPKLPTCACRNSPQFADFLKSATGQLPKLPTCACRNSPLVCRFSCHWTDTYMCCAEIPPWGADFPKSATGQLPKLPTCACRNPPSLQIFQNLPLDSYLSYLHVLADSLPSPVCRFSKICHHGQLPKYMCLQKFFPWGADYSKSATGQLPKLPTCACRNSPPVCRFSKICHWTDSYMCLQKFPPENLPLDSYPRNYSLQIFQNLPLDSYLSYLHLLAEIPPCSLQIFQNLPLDSYSYMCLQKFPPPSLQIFQNLPLDT